MAPRSVSDSRSVDELAREVLSVAGSLSDPAMTTSYVRSILRGLAPEPRSDLLTILHAASVTRDPRASGLWLIVAVVLAAATEEELLEEVVRVLEDRGQADLAEVMRGVPVVSTAAARVPDFGKGRPLSLGERKSIARTHDRGLLSRVIRDPHPAVIRILLDNPHVTETDVIRLVSQRPIHADVLREVCCSTRWVVRLSVRVALLKNPQLPVPFGLRLAPSASVAALRAITASPELDPRLREACATLLGRPTLH